MHYPNNARSMADSMLWGSLGALALSLGVAGLSMVYVPKESRLVPLGASLMGLALAGGLLDRRNFYQAQLEDMADIEGNALKQKLLLNTHDLNILGQTPTEPVKTTPLKYQIVDARDVFSTAPHIAVLASSGSGKSFFVRWILNYHLTDQPRLIIDPHGDRGLTVKSLDHALDLIDQLRVGSLKSLIVGYGRNYESIYYIFQALQLELDYRFSNGGESANFPFLNIVIEELPSLVGGVDEFDRGYVSKVLKTYLTESRKVNLRLIVVTQGSEVGLLGLKNMSSLKSGYRFIRLGREAIKHAGLKGLDDLESVLTDDFYKSLDIHRRSKSKAMFKGTCFMVDDSEHIPFRDLRIWGNEPLESDLIDPQFQNSQTPSLITENLPGPLEVTDHATNGAIDDTPESQAHPPANGCESPVTPSHTSGDHPAVTPPSPPPSYYRRWGITPPESQGESNFKTPPTDTGYHIPQLKTEPIEETKVEVKIESFWLRKYNDCPSFEALESNRPPFIQDRHIERYFELRGQGDTPSKACKTLFGGGKYAKANVWLKEVYDLLTILV